MPDRFLREAILRSERIGSLTMGGVVLYYKLLSLVDDYGCFDGREMVIASMSGWRFAMPLPLRELHQFNLIVRYLNGDKPYIALTQWAEARRGRRKWPAPPINTDTPELEYSVPFNQQPNWKNPLGSDRVSVLLDLDLRVVDPQPGEWRRTESDWMPRGSDAPTKVHDRDRKKRGTAQAPAPVSRASILPQSAAAADSDTQHQRSHDAARASALAQQASVSSSVSTSSSSSSSASLPTPQASAPATPPPRSVLPQQPATTSGADGNGKVELTDSGEWHGVSEPQRLRWQGMFPTMSIPDQLDRAGAWLLAHPEERREYSASGELEQYLIRWLLREARAAEKTQ